MSFWHRFAPSRRRVEGSPSTEELALSAIEMLRGKLAEAQRENLTLRTQRGFLMGICVAVVSDPSLLHPKTRKAYMDIMDEHCPEWRQHYSG